MVILRVVTISVSNENLVTKTVWYIEIFDVYI